MRRKKSKNGNGDEKVKEVMKKVPSSLSECDTEEWDEQPVSAGSSPPTLKKVLTRTLAASVLALFFLGLLQAGHFYCILLVLVLFN